MQHQFSHQFLRLLLALFVAVGSTLAVTRANAEQKPVPAASKVIADGTELIGEKCPDFVGLKWLDGKNHRLNEFAGHPVLIRFWNKDCTMCSASAPVLNELQQKYGQKGLVVIGIHHRKGPTPDSTPSVRAAAQTWKMHFPIAIDNDWQTLNRIWMTKKRSMTSATILLGKDGRILWVHPGGVLDDRRPDFMRLEKTIGDQLGTHS